MEMLLLSRGAGAARPPPPLKPSCRLGRFPPLARLGLFPPPPTIEFSRRPGNLSLTIKITNRRPPQEDKEEEEEEDAEVKLTVPEAVMRRTAWFVGVPLALWIASSPLSSYLHLRRPVTWLFLSTALLGYVYAALSASWDPDRQGSLLGWDEVRLNWNTFTSSYQAIYNKSYFKKLDDSMDTYFKELKDSTNTYIKELEDSMNTYFKELEDSVNNDGKEL